MSAARHPPGMVIPPRVEPQGCRRDSAARGDEQRPPACPWAVRQEPDDVAEVTTRARDGETESETRERISL